MLRFLQESTYVDCTCKRMDEEDLYLMLRVTIDITTLQSGTELVLTHELDSN
ncbi:hypothetical protein [Virgibacillus salexigens]|uniref:hypothetical protein n=1 Tax=Virgibacillus massiliensis TaxID=1462526 RepID=UPI00130507B0|nr:hypothetical protein [Virgibacillus massiliensis]